MSKQEQDSKPAEVQQPARKPRNRRFSKEIMEDNDKVQVLKIVHIPYKGKKISDTIRTDRKFNPNQRFSAGRREL